jgi:transcriptional regulator of acetoin/glycerol metabolism
LRGPRAVELFQQVTTNDAARVEPGQALYSKRVRKDGTVIDVSITASPIRDSNGNIVGVSAITRDITERKRAQEHLAELERARLRQQQAMEINDTVVQGLVVASYSLERGDRESAKRAVDNTLASARSLITQLLESSAEQGPLRPGDLRRSRAAEVTRPRE